MSRSVMWWNDMAALFQSRYDVEYHNYIGKYVVIICQYNAITGLDI